MITIKSEPEEFQLKRIDPDSSCCTNLMSIRNQNCAETNEALSTEETNEALPTEVTRLLNVMSFENFVTLNF